MNAYKKTLRISAAIRILASMLESSDPMTRDLLETAQKLTKMSLMWCVAYSANTRLSFEHELQLLSAYLEISERSGLVSPRTVSVLKSECSEVMDIVKERGNSTDNNILPAEVNFPKGMFDISKTSDVSEATNIDGDGFINRSLSLSSRNGIESKNLNSRLFENNSEFNKRHVGQNSSENLKTSYGSRTGGSIGQERSISNKTKDIVKGQLHVSDSVAHSDRKDIIVSAVRKMGSVTIKDLSPFVSGVSEKTIQRELVSLVAQGVLKKEGERRWSRYQVVEGTLS